MAFPVTPLPVVHEASIGGAWEDITSDVYTRSLVTVTRGRGDEAAQIDPTKLPLVLNNRTGDYSPRNPTGTWYGLIGRNTPVRSSIDGPVHMTLAGASGSYASAPDTAGTSITGDIDVRIDLSVWDWTNPLDLAGKYGTAGTRSWALYRTFDGLLAFRWSVDGTAFLERFSTVAIPVPAGAGWRVGLRATLDVDDGAGGHVVRFYTTRDVVAGEDDLTTATWTQLGDPVTTAGTTSIFNSTAATYAGAVQAGSTALVTGRLWELQVRSGIGGSLAANPRFRDQVAGATSFADAQTNTWTLAGAAALSDRDVRGAAEVSSWPVRWDVSQRDVWTQVEGAGILRRLGQGEAPLESTLRRAYARLGSVVGYWPCEDVAGASFLASAVGGQPMRMNGEAADLAAYSGFVASKPIPTLKAATEFAGVVPSHAVTGQAQVRLLVDIPAAGTGDGQTILQVVYSGTATTWQIRYGLASGGTLTIRAFDADNTSLLNSGPWGFDVNGTARQWSLELTQNGADIDWAVKTLTPGVPSGLAATGTVTGQTVGRAVRVTCSPTGDTEGISIGHVVVQDSVTSLFELSSQLAAYAGETAGRRIRRLCSEENVPFRVMGDLDDTTPVGVQRPDTLLNLLGEAAAADLGILHEPRDFLGLCYRPRATLENQIASATVPYTALAEFTPVEDDQAVRNDVEITRAGGSSSRQTEPDGPLGTTAIGTYPQATTLNLADDSVLDDHASWRLHLGTVDQPRHPSIELALEHPDIAGDAVLTRRLRDLDLGDRIVITGPPGFAGPPDDVTQLVQGLVETLGVHEHGLALTCTPETPWHVLVADDPAAVADSDGSTLAAGITAGATSMSVATASQRVWTTAAGDLPLLVRVGGEVISVGSITGTTSPQTFGSLTRAVNGVSKAHDAGAVVELADPVHWAL